MKKLKFIIFLLIIICFIILILIFNNNTSRFSKDINLTENACTKIELVKSIASDHIYFPFKDNNKNYILLGYRISSYSDLEKSSMKIQKTKYKNGNLIIELEIDEVRTNL